MSTEIDRRAFMPAPRDALVTADGQRYEVARVLVFSGRVEFEHSTWGSGFAYRFASWDMLVRRILREGGRFEPAGGAS